MARQRFLLIVIPSILLADILYDLCVRFSKMLEMNTGTSLRSRCMLILLQYWLAMDCSNE